MRIKNNCKSYPVDKSSNISSKKAFHILPSNQFKLHRNRSRFFAWLICQCTLWFSPYFMTFTLTYNLINQYFSIQKNKFCQNIMLEYSTELNNIKVTGGKYWKIELILVWCIVGCRCAVHLGGPMVRYYRVVPPRWFLLKSNLSYNNTNWTL